MLYLTTLVWAFIKSNQCSELHAYMGFEVFVESNQCTILVRFNALFRSEIQREHVFPGGLVADATSNQSSRAPQHGDWRIQHKGVLFWYSGHFANQYQTIKHEAMYLSASTLCETFLVTLVRADMTSYQLFFSIGFDMELRLCQMLFWIQSKPYSSGFGKSVHLIF